MDKLPLPEGYQLRRGERCDRALLFKFLVATYEELFPEQPDFSHLSHTLGHYFSGETPTWWIDATDPTPVAVAGIWVGSAIDQATSDRTAHIFWLYVSPSHRQLGLAKYLLSQAEVWAARKGFNRISLQTFSQNQAALNLYATSGFETQSLLMSKPVDQSLSSIQSGIPAAVNN
ncbi:MAG: GNAT family N-acetyltransferase [Cyanobacteria bacterium P01_H01_bin.15]